MFFLAKKTNAAMVNTLHVGVGVRLTNVLLIHRHMIDQQVLSGLTLSL